ncbi:MAG: hypothetical protein CBC25_07645 [Pelagibacteraceae bacterium TMED65]|nr:MAG: hypothetical protein CBC25_07645 [Pelagibacteraceae bacterium TMED65]|tara:strand:+ start:2254 stop:3111 length:858 start_codon:yes stop_codon:yes gene_type:complete
MFYNFLKLKDPALGIINNFKKILCPRVFKFNQNLYRMYFSCNNINNYTNIKSAISKDCLTWDIENGVRISKLEEKKFSRILSPSIIKIDKNLYRMYFEARSSDKNGVIKSAISNNGYDWIEEKGTRIGNLDLISFGTPFCIKERNKSFKLFFQRRSGFKKEICFAESTDGLLFNDKKIVSLIKQENKYETYSVLGPDIIYLNNIYHMFYSGWSLKPLKGYILYAYSHDGINWTKRDSPVLSPGDIYDKKHCSEPSVIKINNLWKIFYEACDRDNTWRILCAQQSR